MAEYIDREYYCEHICICNSNHCDKDNCTVWDAPAEDVEPIKHGKWLIHEQQAPKGRKIKYSTKQCSVCGKWNGRHATNYCPKCGAKMDGDSNG